MVLRFATELKDEGDGLLTEKIAGLVMIRWRLDHVHEDSPGNQQWTGSKGYFCFTRQAQQGLSAINHSHLP